MRSRYSRVKVRCGSTVPILEPFGLATWPPARISSAQRRWYPYFTGSNAEDWVCEYFPTLVLAWTTTPVFSTATHHGIRKRTWKASDIHMYVVCMQ